MVENPAKCSFLLCPLLLHDCIKSHNPGFSRKSGYHCFPLILLCFVVVVSVSVVGVDVGCFLFVLLLFFVDVTPEVSAAAIKL